MLRTRPENVPDFSGRTIAGGQLRLMERLGIGAFGAVYRAEQMALDRPLREVAVKLTHQRLLDPDQAAEQLREGFILAEALQQAHPDARKHLVQVHGIGLAAELERRAYMVMEYIPGVRLLDHISCFQESIPMETARRYFREICAAVAVFHRQDPPVTHGDLKPDNVLIDQSSSIRLVDFGLAKPVERLAGFAVRDEGCMTYVAPEVIYGRGLPESDIYSLGLIMYEVLTGGGPHLEIPEAKPGDTHAHFLAEKRKLRFPPIREMNNSVAQDAALFHVVQRCCRCEPEQRYESIEAVLADLEAGPPEDESTCEPESPPSDWKRQAELFRQAGDGKNGLLLIDSCNDSRHLGSDPEYGAYKSIFLTRAGQHMEAVELGQTLFERASLPEQLKMALAKTLYESSEQLAKKNEKYRAQAEYYKARQAY